MPPNPDDQASWYPRTVEEQANWMTQHPMLGRYRFPTPPLLEACRIATTLIDLRVPCCSFFALPRFGKTRTAEYLKRHLDEAMPRVHVLSTIFKRDTSKTARIFLDRLNVDTGGSPISRSKDAELAITRRWVAEAGKRGADQIVIIGDEMGRLTVKELTTLADITNTIDAEGLSLTTIGFGSVDMVQLKNMLYEENRLDLISRFFSQQFDFSGIEDVATLRSILECFDDPSYCFPPDTRCCFTQFFLPRQYIEGFRLSGLANRIWDEFMKLAGVKKVVGATHVFAAAQTFLRSASSVVRIEENRVEECLQTAIKLSGYTAFVRELDSKRFSR